MVEELGGVMHYKAILKLKPHLLLFIYFFFHQKLNRAAEDHSELGSICHDEGPGTLALPAPRHPRHPPPPTTTTPPPSSASIRLHYTETFHFALPNCQSPLVWFQLTVIFILGGAVALVLAGVRPLLPLLSWRATRAGWNLNEAVVSELSKLSCSWVLNVGSFRGCLDSVAVS